MFGRKKKKQSFFEKLTGAVSIDDFEEDEMDYNQRGQGVNQEDDQDYYSPENNQQHTKPHRSIEIQSDPTEKQGHHVDTSPQEPGFEEHHEEKAKDEQLSVDVVNAPEHIIIHSMLAGVKPSDIDIDISRDMITIKGTREDLIEEESEDFFHQELHWGSFSRNILLPEEIDVDSAEATEKHGLLTLKLPKLDKNRKTKVHVKSR